MTQIRISGKNLGGLAIDSFCPRCFWLKMHCKGLPYQIFPGIFSSIDSYTKKVTNVHYQKSSTIPSWLQGFDDLVKPVKTPHHSKFYVIDPEMDIHLTGVPDEIFQRSDGSYFIADYKTAKFTGNQDKLLPMYEIQLNSYAFIGNLGDFKPVAGIGLVYYEPQTDLTSGSLSTVLSLRVEFPAACGGAVHFWENICILSYQIVCCSSTGGLNGANPSMIFQPWNST